MLIKSCNEINLVGLTAYRGGLEVCKPVRPKKGAEIWNSLLDEISMKYVHFPGICRVSQMASIPKLSLHASLSLRLVAHP